MTKLKERYCPAADKPTTLILGIQSPSYRGKDIALYYEEFVSLVHTSGIEYAQEMYLKLRAVDSPYYLTKGKLGELKEFCDKEEIEQVIISEILTPQQERNLSEFLECTVMDRTDLILDIFEKAAHSAEGKMQVAIAKMRHLKPRLAGKGIDLAQQKGVIGMRSGAGESAKEKEMRIIEEEILKLTRQLKKLHQTRETQRKQRRTSGIPQICIIGYTNAGKSTLINTLTKSAVLAEDKLFVTLDTTTRELHLGSNKKALISDTVGFIQNLPHKLIEAFKSTLDELQYADLLLHVVDASNEDWRDQIKVVNRIIEELDVHKEMLYVFNKADKVADQTILDHEFVMFQPHVVISARTAEGIKPLVNYLSAWKPE